MDLGLYPYKIQLVQELINPLIIVFVLRLLLGRSNFWLEIHFFGSVMFSDETHFWLNGFVTAEFGARRIQQQQQQM